MCENCAALHACLKAAYEGGVPAATTRAKRFSSAHTSASCGSMLRTLPRPAI